MSILKNLFYHILRYVCTLSDFRDSVLTFSLYFLRFFLVLWIISIEVQRLTSSFGICEIELFQFFKHLVCPFWLAEVLWIIYFYGCTMYIVVNNTIHYLQKPDLYVCNCALDNKCFLIKRLQYIDRSLGLWFVYSMYLHSELGIWSFIFLDFCCYYGNVRSCHWPMLFLRCPKNILSVLIQNRSRVHK